MQAYKEAELADTINNTNSAFLPKDSLIDVQFFKVEEKSIFDSEEVYSQIKPLSSLKERRCARQYRGP